MRVISELSEAHVLQLHALYASAWWAKTRSLEDTRRCVRGSSICIGLVDGEDALQGFCRVLTDGVFKAVVFDVLVSPAHQGRGLGALLMAQLKAHERLAQVGHIELYCKDDVQAFYRHHGFAPQGHDLHFMRWERQASHEGL